VRLAPSVGDDPPTFAPLAQAVLDAIAVCGGYDEDMSFVSLSLARLAGAEREDKEKWNGCRPQLVTTHALALNFGNLYEATLAY
jgi:hypothetical protein